MFSQIIFSTTLSYVFFLFSLKAIIHTRRIAFKVEVEVAVQGLLRLPRQKREEAYQSADMIQEYMNRKREDMICIDLRPPTDRLDIP